MIVTVRGASGSGKTITVDSLLQLFITGKRLVSYTTRPMDKSDPPGKYIYVTEEE